MADPEKPTPRRLNLEIPANLAATYANFALISHSASEVFLDFAQILPNTPKARVQARMVLSPVNAKMLLKALQENIERYEAQHGEINTPARPTSLADQLFSTIRGSDEDGDENGDETANETGNDVDTDDNDANADSSDSTNDDE